MVMTVAGSIVLARPDAVTAQVSEFRTGVEMVALTVTVTDGSGRYVTDLTAPDFVVVEDGVRQPVSFFAAGEVPVDVALVIDASGSMRADMPMVRAAARGLLQSLEPHDRSAILAVTASVSVRRPFSSNHAETAAGLDDVSASGSSAIFDGLYVALRELEKGRQWDQARGHVTEIRRKVLVLLSDGLDTSSHLSAEDVADTARRVGASVYLIVLSTVDSVPALHIPRAQARARFDLRALASDTGGRSFSPTKASELAGVYEAIACELDSQYDLGYLPQMTGRGEAFRRVAVRVLPPAVGVARTRSGYYAPRASEPVIGDQTGPRQ